MLESQRLINNLIKKQDTSDEEINRICQRLSNIWLQSNAPKKYSMPASEAEILIRAMQKQIKFLHETIVKNNPTA